jgi:hypothetical protein
MSSRITRIGEGRRSRLGAAVGLAALLAIVAAFVSAAEAPRPRRTLGFSVAAEGYGGGTGFGAGEMEAIGLVLDPFRWGLIVPSFSAIASVPAFPWDPRRTLLEARLDLRIVTARLAFLDRLMFEPTLYAPTLSASLLLPAGGGSAKAAFGLRPFAVRMGDGIYSVLSPAIVLDPVDGMRAAGYSIELFEFAYFLF